MTVSEPEVRSVAVASPTLIHAVGAVLNAASWLTIGAMLVMALVDFTPLRASTEMWLIAVPAGFRILGSGLYGVRGTRVAWLAVLADVGLLTAMATDADHELVFLTILATAMASNAVPAWWGIRLRRAGALVGMLGIAAGLAVAAAYVGRQEVAMLALLAATIGLAIPAQGVVAYWALRGWRARNPREDGAFT